jgi:hypothetical protein
MARKIKAKEKQEYDNFVGKTELIEPEKNDLSVLFGDDLKEEEDDSWKGHWKDMPEFVIDDNRPYKSLLVNFQTEEDFKEFCSLVSQKISYKTKSISYPYKKRSDNSLWKWIEEDSHD